MGVRVTFSMRVDVIFRVTARVSSRYASAYFQVRFFTRHSIAVLAGLRS